MFNLYLAKVNSLVKRQLSESELKTVRSFFENGFSANYTAEFLK